MTHRKGCVPRGWLRHAVILCASAVTVLSLADTAKGETQNEQAGCSVTLYFSNPQDTYPGGGAGGYGVVNGVAQGFYCVSWTVTANITNVQVGLGGDAGACSSPVPGAVNARLRLLGVANPDNLTITGYFNPLANPGDAGTVTIYIHDMLGQFVCQFGFTARIPPCPLCPSCPAAATTRPDGWMRDNTMDVGVESGPPGDLWISPDIWVRNTNAMSLPTLPGRHFTKEHDHENPEFAMIPANAPWIYAKVCNRGNAPISGTVYFYFACAASGLVWPTIPSGTFTLVNDQIDPSGYHGSRQVGPLSPGDVWVVDQQWQNIQAPSACFVGTDIGHYCLVARFISNPPSIDPIDTPPETPDIWQNAYDHNNIAWRNVHVEDLKSNNIAPPGGGSCDPFYFRNISGADTSMALTFNAPANEAFDTFLNHGRVFAHLELPMMLAWQAAGGAGTGIVAFNDSTIEIVDSIAEMAGIPMHAAEERVVCMEFDLLSNQYFADEKRFQFNAIQFVTGAQRPDGGMNYDIRIRPTCFADGDVNGDSIPLSIADAVMLNQVLLGLVAAPPTISHGDFNGDCVIDSLDAALFSCYFNSGMSCFSQFPIPTCCNPNIVLACSCPCYADPNCDSVRSDVVDVVGTINVAFRGIAATLDLNCPAQRTDVDCSGATDVIDVVKVIDVAFRGADVALKYCNPCQ